MALCMLGTRYDQAIQAHTGRFPLGLRLHQQILQVDQIQTPGLGYSKESSEATGQHHPLVWSTEQHHH